MKLWSTSSLWPALTARRQRVPRTTSTRPPISAVRSTCRRGFGGFRWRQPEHTNAGRGDFTPDALETSQEHDERVGVVGREHAADPERAQRRCLDLDWQ